MAAECLGARVRLLSRTVTHLYDQAFRPLGVKAAQMNVLVVVASTLLGDALRDTLEPSKRAER